jgi:hypothetical protein
LQLYVSEEKALSLIDEEYKSNIDEQPAIATVAVPTFFLTLPVIYYVFLDVDIYLREWSLLLRWPAATIMASFAWLIFFFLWFLSNLSPARTRIDYVSLRSAEEGVTDLEVEDQNDIHIICQIANLDSLHRKIETYTLESALLSALSFSSFLSIALSERNYDKELRTLFPPPFETRASPWPFSVPGVGTIDQFSVPSATYLNTHIVALIAIALLLCATTFLGVLVARLRFNDGYRDADSALKAADRLNERENSAYELGLTDKAGIYATVIDNMLQKAEELERGLSITVMQMRWSRNAGIFFFIVALILCGLFFNGWVAALVASVFVVAVLFGSIDRLTRSELRRRIFDQGGVSSLLRPFKPKR